MSLSIFDAAHEASNDPGLIVDSQEHSFAALARGAALAGKWLAEQGCFSARTPLVALVATPLIESFEMLYALIAWRLPVLLVHPKLTVPEQAKLRERFRPMLWISSQWKDEPVSAPQSPPPPEPDSVTSLEVILAIVQTSGTQGHSKGALLSRRAFVAAAGSSARNLGWQDDDRWLLDLPFSHIGGLSILTRCLLARQCVVATSPGRFCANRWFKTVTTHRVTLASLVPTQLRHLLDARPQLVPPQTLRAMLVGGAPTPQPLLDRALNERWPTLTTYGLTEACSQVAAQSPRIPIAERAGCGQPLERENLKIDHGEIFVRGDALFSGYFNATPRARSAWHATGDAGFLDAQHQLHITGRLDDRLLTGGENVDPQEVELALESCPGVVQACVFGIDDPTWGTAVAAAVICDSSLSTGATPEDTIMAFLTTCLANFKRPRKLVFVEDFKYSAVGKLDRAATRCAVGLQFPM